MQLAPDKTANPSSYRRETEDRDICDREIAAELPEAPFCPDSAADEVVLLDDFTPPPATGRSTLSDSDLRLVEALQAVLRARGTDNSIKIIRAQICDELDWV